MDPNRYLALLRDDERLLAVAAQGNLDATVPSCPGWSVADLVDHLGHVYLHKVECMRQQQAPDPWPPQPHGRDPLDWLSEQAAVLFDELTARGPASPSYTWHQPDQTVGFWYRRMAQETAVHRVDAELAAGAPTPVDAELALDGVDELLDVMFCGDWSDEPHPELTGRVQLRAAGRSWLVVLEPEEVRLESGEEAEATVDGTPSDLLLWLWGRLPDGSVRIGGAGETAARLRRRLVLATG